MAGRLGRVQPDRTRASSRPPPGRRRGAGRGSPQRPARRAPRLRRVCRSRFVRRLAELSEQRMNLAEGPEDFAVGGEKCRAVDRAARDERRGHVPVAEHHSERRVALAAQDCHELFEGLGIEVAEEPVARLAQDRLAPELEQAQVQQRALEGRGMRTVSAGLEAGWLGPGLGLEVRLLQSPAPRPQPPTLLPEIPVRRQSDADAADLEGVVVRVAASSGK